MKNNLSAFFAGFIFSSGLVISGMTNPEKVKGFLNVFGPWDPSLIFVMLAAVSVHFITYKMIRRRKSPLFSSHWHVSEKSEITKSLVMGSILFGIGWGIAGFCPGPAITLLATVHSTTIIFVASMLLGMFIFKLIDKKIKFNR